jgi:hypothetical protein
LGLQYQKGDGKFKRKEPELGFFRTKLRDKEGLKAQNKRHVKDEKEKKDDEKESKEDKDKLEKEEKDRKGNH